MTAEDKLRRYIIKKYGEIDYGKTEKNIKNLSKHFESILKNGAKQRKSS